MSIEKIESLLKEIGQISNCHAKISKISGENFNLFRILKLEDSETRLHSALIGELLNPKGTHGQDDKFLSLFLNNLENKIDFVTSSAKVEVEFYIGRVDPKSIEGGRIDIKLTDSKGVNIIIENKIYASDQKSQLCRYKDAYPNSRLFYLNLTGEKPSEKSTTSEIRILKDDEYEIITYKDTIIQWLEQCKKEAVSLPIIRETISQYINLLKFLTNQTTMDKMKDEIKKLIKYNPDYVSSLQICALTWSTSVNDINSKFWEVLRKMSPDYPIELINGLKIRTIFKEDYTGFWCGYELISGTETLTGENSEKKLITDLFKKELSKIESNKNWIGWFYPKQFKKDEKLIDNAGLISKIISDDSYIEDLVKKIVEEEKEISGLLKKVLKENNFI